jgi:LUD domain
MDIQTLNFAAPASESELESLADRLRERNFEVVIVDSASQAKAAVMERIPAGSQVHSGKSKTLEDAGVFEELMASDRYDFIRRRTLKMDRRTQGDEIRKLSSAPDIMLGSVQAVTEAGQLLFASASGSQIGPLGSGAGKLILVIGSQKIVPDLDSDLRRIREHVMPYEDARLREQIGLSTKLTRVLIMEQDYAPGRTTIVLVRNSIGI